MEKLKVPSHAELTKIAIADINNSFVLLEDRHRAHNGNGKLGTCLSI
jgi:nucleotide exchange factor SIL1